jgi:hypothetical protein
MASSSGRGWGSARTVGLAALLGALGGAALDQIHVQSGVLAYPHSSVFEQSWWVAPQFGLAVLAMLVAAGPVAAAASRQSPLPSAAQVSQEAVWFIGAYAASGLFGNGHGAELAVIYVLSWVARLARRADRLVAGVASVTLAAGGILYEGTLAGTGAFHYTHPAVYHVPIWLAGIYLHGAFLLIDVARHLPQLTLPSERRKSVEPRP